ncbi:MAG: histidinol dehydrogenase [Candidatus Brocadiaceae bacterium]|nr:histidinol dehydrogenase [Candidatus Brocadiaceae bacterium]
MRILKAWRCDINKEIEGIKQQLSLLDGASSNRDTVRKIIQDVQKRGDKAITMYSKRFDAVALTPDKFRVREKEVDDAYRYISSSFIKSIQRAIKNIRRYQEHIRIHKIGPLKAHGVVLDTLYYPLESVGVYVPGGAASYPSTVLMNTIPASVAGVDKIIMTTPPREDGAIPAERLVAAREAGVHEIYKVGGAQAVAALAFGTQTIPKVDKIVGPGNIFVTLAKKEVFGYSGIDMLAGPSEVLILADEYANPSYVASDLLSQAEHAPGISILVTYSESLAERTMAEINRQIIALRRRTETMKCLDKYGIIILAKTMKQSIAISNSIAPEHLQILTRNPRTILSSIRHAGAIFLGSYTPVAIGDYIAGPSHVLPTSGTARFTSGLSVNDFLKRSSVITYSRSALKDICLDLTEISEHEGLDAHTRSVRIRLDTQTDKQAKQEPVRKKVK